jgi:O-succinylbenzoate synthase
LLTSARIGVVPRAVADLPSLAELQDAAYVVTIPLRVSFRGLMEREVLLLHGPSGWGEFGPFGEYDEAESARWLAAGIEAGWGRWPEPVRSEIPVNATVPAVGPGDVVDVLARFPGATTAKVKVAETGQRLDEDVDRVAAVADALGGSPGRIRVDANGAWTVDEARDALPRLASAAASAIFEYAEQPCATIEELATLRVALARDGHDIRVAADESVRKAEDPLRMAVAGAADVIVVKVAPLGGVRPALEVAQELGAAHGLPIVVSSALDSAVGIGAGLALAAALPELPYACGLATVGLFAAGLGGPAMVAHDGVIAVRRGDPDLQRVAALAAPPERETWWRDRLARCHAQLAAESAS